MEQVMRSDRHVDGKLIEYDDLDYLEIYFINIVQVRR